jgi:hypothetical protein
MTNDPKFVSDFKKFTRTDPTVDMIDELHREVYGFSDRATVVMIGAFLDLSLTRYITARLRPDLSSDSKQRLFDHRGPLGSFSNKIEIAFAMGALGPVTCKDLHIIREMRNGAAHSRVNFTFETPEVAAMCAHLRTPKKGSSVPFLYLQHLKPEDREAAKDPNNPKTRFHIAAHDIAGKMLELRNTVTFADYAEAVNPGALP